MPPKPNTYQGRFYFDPRDPIYADHFPGFAVVPGSLIVHAFFLAGREIGISMNGRRVEQFRFQHFVAPGYYRFRLDHTDVNCLKCALTDGPTIVATGRLVAPSAVANKDHAAESGNSPAMHRDVT